MNNVELLSTTPRKRNENLNVFNLLQSENQTKKYVVLLYFILNIDLTNSHQKQVVDRLLLLLWIKSTDQHYRHFILLPFIFIRC